MATNEGNQVVVTLQHVLLLVSHQDQQCSSCTVLTEKCMQTPVTIPDAGMEGVLKICQ